MRILLVEDDAMLGDGLAAGLKMGGWSVDWLRDGESARAALVSEKYAACVLDLGLPGRDGLSVLKDLRGRGDVTPVLVLTARDSREDKIAGLDAGADDYLTKPFDLLELQARLRALQRRASGQASSVLSHKGVSLDPASRQVVRDDRIIVLSAHEFALLHDLLANKNCVRSRRQLEDSLYGWSGEVESNTVEVYIHHLRKKFGSDFIRTIRGVGYVVGDLQ